MPVPERLHAVVADPPIGVEDRSGLHGVGDEPLQAGGRCIRDPAQADPPDPCPVLLRPHRYQGLLGRLPAPHPGLHAAHEGLVHLHHAVQSVPAEPDHTRRSLCSQAQAVS